MQPPQQSIELSIHPFSLWNWMDGQTKETRETQVTKETKETKERSRTIIDSDFSVVSMVPMVSVVSKKISDRRDPRDQETKVRSRTMVDSDFSVVSVVPSVSKCLKKNILIPRKEECPSIQLHRENGWMDKHKRRERPRDQETKAMSRTTADSDFSVVSAVSVVPSVPKYLKKNILIPRKEECPSIQFHRENGWMDRTPPPPTGYIPEWVWERSRTIEVLADHVRWMASIYFGATLANKDS